MVHLNSSWLNGKYNLLEAEVEINTSLSYLSVKFTGGENYFFQGDEADTETQEILDIWLGWNLTQSEAVSNYLKKF